MIWGDMDTLLISQYVLVRMKFAQSTRATKGSMNQISFEHVIWISGATSICMHCLTWCREIHLGTLSVLMLQNPSTCFVRIDVAKSIRALCPDLRRKIHPHALSLQFFSRG